MHRITGRSSGKGSERGSERSSGRGRAAVDVMEGDEVEINLNSESRKLSGTREREIIDTKIKSLKEKSKNIDCIVIAPEGEKIRFYNQIRVSSTY
jgi:hypothetical protein